MIQVNVHEAKTRLSELMAAASRGEDVVIAKAGVPQVRLLPHSASAETAAARESALGMWAGRYDDAAIDALLAPLTPTELALFYGTDASDTSRVDAAA